MEPFPSSHYVSFLGGEQNRRQSMWNRVLKNNRTKARLVVAVAFLSVVFFTSIFLWLQVSDDGSSDFLIDDSAKPFRRAVRPTEIWAWEEVDFQNEFESFRTLHKKSYTTNNERQLRYGIFKKNLYYIYTHNSQGHSYTLQMNMFGDMTSEEFKTRFISFRKNEEVHESAEVYSAPAKADGDLLPTSKDWRDMGCVTPVKNQQKCGSCWAFSATGAMEGAFCAKSGGKNTPSFSEQQLVDCSRDFGNEGCGGGDMSQAFRYVEKNGICLETEYPYEALDKTCRLDSCKPSYKITGLKKVTPNCSHSLRSALVKYGPVSVAIDAGDISFQFYEKGVFDGECGETLNHGVLSVGYGVESGKQFWLVKNSWGSEWGESGYIKLARNSKIHGQCGILKEGSFPTV